LVSERAFEEAETQLRTGLSVLREHYSNDISHTLHWELQLVFLVRRMARPAEANVEMRRVLDEARSAFGSDNSITQKLEAMLARTLLEANSELEEAETVA
jgi:hypothetical protein